MSKSVVRPATPDDMPAIRRQDPDFPGVADPAMLECFVVEKDGEVIGSFCFEKSVRLGFLGTSPETLAALRDIQDQVFRTSNEAGVRFMHCLISSASPSADEVSRHLQESGFERRDDLIEYVLDLRRVKDQHCEPLTRIDTDSQAPRKWLM